MADRGAAAAGRAVAVMVAATLGAAVGSAQPVPQHGPGLVIPVGDLDGDGCGDLLVHDGVTLQAWFGTRGQPWLRPGAITRLVLDERCARPVVSMRRLYAATAGADAREIVVQSWPLATDGSPGAAHTHRLRSDDPDAEIVHLRLAALNVDRGNDGEGDVLALHREESTRGRGRFVATFVGPRAASRSQWIPLPRDEEEPVACIALGPTRSLAQPPDECVLVITDAAGRLGRGFAIANVGPDAAGDPVRRGLFAVPLAPALEVPGPGDADAPLLQALSHPTPALAMPVLRLADGPSFTLHATTFAPFVAASGRWVETSVDGFAVADSAADYDGDGSDEVVFVDRSPLPGFDVVAIAGPHPADGDFQAWLWRAPADPWQHGRRAFDVAHAAPVDFDGDGDPDLVMSLRSAGVAAASSFALFRSEPSAASPQRTLVRVW